MPQSIRRVVLPLLLLTGLFVTLGAVRESDNRRLESARAAYLEDLSEARQMYISRLADAEKKLRRHYDVTIERYASRDETGAVQSIRNELDAFLLEQSASADADAVAEAAAEGGHLDLIESIGPLVVDSRGSTYSSQNLASNNYMLLYFSAEWCPPCRGFTPDLVKFVERNRSGGNFDLIFVSSDRSAREQLSYMRSYKMPWSAVPFDRINPSGLKGKYGGRGIPNLVVVDRDGNKVLSSYTDGGKYVGPRAVLRDFDQLLAQK